MSALRKRRFRRLWAAGLISDMGDWLLLVSLPILVYQYTGSTLGTAGAFLVELIPPVVLAPVAGRLADRLDRRLVLTLLAGAQAAALTPLLLVHSAAQLPIIYAVLAVESALSSMFEPTKNAFLPTLVAAEALLSANSLVGLGENVGRLVGGSLGGVLLATGGGLTTIVVVDAASFLLAVALIASLGSSAPTAASAQIREANPSSRGWRATLSTPQVRHSLIVLFIASVAQGIFVVLFVVFVVRVLHGGSAEVGLLRGVQAIGAIAAGLALALVARIRPGSLVAGAAIAFGVIDLAAWNAPNLTTSQPLYVALFIAVGAPGVALTAGLTSVVQQATVDGQRGKAFAAAGVAMAVGEAVGIIAAGVLGASIGVVVLLNAQGALYLLAGLIARRCLSGRLLRSSRITPSTSPSLSS